MLYTYMKTAMFRLPFLLCVLMVCGAGTTGAQTSVSTHDAKAVLVPATVNRALMLKLVNDARKRGCQCGDTYYYPAPPLTWNDQLEMAAYNHTADMAKNKFFAHLAPDGSKAGKRIERAGYVWKAYGENIGQGYKTEKEMVAGWLASPSHCKNILNKNFKEMGVGRVGTLWTQTFARK
jgi:uncharacterized protein YkwD